MQDVDLSPDQQSFIQDMIGFLDAPLSPKSLAKLRKACAEHTSPQRRGDAAAQPVTGQQGLAPGTPIVVRDLVNNPDFNGLYGKVVQSTADKVLIEFDGGEGQLFNLPAWNVCPVSLGATPGAQSAPAGAAPGVEPAGRHYVSQQVAGLQERLRLGMSTVQSAREAMDVAEELHALDPEALHNVIAEFQPTLTRSNIARNWRKIVQIYQAHADRVERSIGVMRTPMQPLGEDDVAGHIAGVIDFIDQPLSPGSIVQIRNIRRSLSPKRDRSSSPF
eukprot:TRINITY_DN13381_c0_g1_i2.p2 TRINITY_DN13381_c0_g1~~TRINITY_DN13381_c0_g1_i2.p2  ORF type:complete len:309 (+),score=107.19 TRINITY_DN13381_c0_g1_i2:105-929(+)